MSDLVLVMLNYLTARCNVWQLNNYDEDLVIVSISAIIQEGESIQSDKVEAWLLENGWAKESAEKVKTIVAKLVSNKEVPVNDFMNAPTEQSMLAAFNEALSEKNQANI